MDITTLPVETILKLVIAMLLGIAMGLERLYARKNAGMRTYALVALAAAFFVTISETVLGSGFTVDADRMRVASQIVVGVGFLGGGLIFMKDEKIANLTTAAGLWVAAAIGIAVGFGLYIEAVVVTLLTLFVFSILAMIERKFKEGMAIHEEVKK